MKKKPGVYLITNLANGKVYVGSSAIGVHERLANHKYLLEKSKHHNRHLQAAWNKYGPLSFTFRVMRYCKVDQCLPLEQQLIYQYNSADQRFGYNISPTAGNTLGVRYPSEIKERMAASIRLAYTRPDVQQSRREMFQRPEYQANRAKAMAKVHADPNYRKKMSASCKKAQSDPVVKARVLAGLRKALDKPEYREKQRIASTGRKHSEDTKRKISEAHSRPEVKAALRARLLGRKVSEETRAKMRKPKTEQAKKNMAAAAVTGWVKRRQTIAGRVQPQKSLF